MRRLLFIRELIAEKRHFDIEVEFGDGSHSPHDIVPSITETIRDDVERAQPKAVNGAEKARCESNETPRGIYDDPTRNKDYYRTVLGVINEKGDIYDSPTLYPEQAAMYSREFAQAAASCCPRGCFEGRLRRAGIDELLELEQEVAAEVHQANLELKEARQKVTHIVPGGALDENEDVINFPTLVEASATDTSVKKGHRVKPSLDGAEFPSDLQLEAELYIKSEQQTTSNSGVALSSENNQSSTASTTNGNPLKSPGETPHECGLTRPQWQQVETLVRESNNSSGSSIRPRQQRRVASGMWEWPSCRRLLGRTTEHVTKANQWAKSSAGGAVDRLSRDSTFAVVTFTSRQAAVAARNCLSDGRGAERWIALSDLPIPPLADAAACDMLACRNCCRPLALGVNERQKMCRNYLYVRIIDDAIPAFSCS